MSFSINTNVASLQAQNYLRVNSAFQGLSLLRNQDFDVVLVSLPVPDRTSAAGLLEELQQAQPGTPVVIHAPQARATEIVGLLRLGAFHVVQHGDVTSLLYMAANTKLAAEYTAEPDDREAEPWRRLLIGESRPMQQVAQCIRLVGARRSGPAIAERRNAASSTVRAMGPMTDIVCHASMVG